MKSVRAYLWNIVIAADQFANTLLAGDPDETISTRAAKHPKNPIWRLLGRVMDAIDPGHMQRALEQEKGE